MYESRRVRVQGDLFHPVLPPNSLYMGRPGPHLKENPYSNPYPVRYFGVDESLRLYDLHLDRNPYLVERARVELEGKDAACWCKPESRCHVDRLLARIGTPASIS